MEVLPPLEASDRPPTDAQPAPTDARGTCAARRRRRERSCLARGRPRASRSRCPSRRRVGGARSERGGLSTILSRSNKGKRPAPRGVGRRARVRRRGGDRAARRSTGRESRCSRCVARCGARGRVACRSSRRVVTRPARTPPFPSPRALVARIQKSCLGGKSGCLEPRRAAGGIYRTQIMGSKFP